MRATILCLLLGVASVGAEEPCAVELPYPASPDQLDFNSCHDYAVTGVLEWALMHYRFNDQKKNVPKLSEADLFLLNAINQKDYLRSLFIRAILGARSAPPKPLTLADVRAEEGQSFEKDFQFALSHGIAESSVLSNHAVMGSAIGDRAGSYARYRERLVETLNELARRVEEKGRRRLAEQREQFVRANSEQTPRELEEQWTQAEPLLVESYYYDVLDSFTKQKQAPSNVAARVELLLPKKPGLIAALNASRQKIRGLLSGLAPLSYKPDSTRGFTKEMGYLSRRMVETDPGKIAQSEADKAEWLRWNLCDRHRPVAVGMLVSPSIGWKTDRPVPHAVIVVGYRENKSDPPESEFLTRNSWGSGNDVPIKVSDLNRVIRMTTIIETAGTKDP